MTLRRNILLILLWTSVIIMFTAHHILTRHDQNADVISHGHAKKNFIPKNVNDDTTLHANLDVVGEIVNTVGLANDIRVHTMEDRQNKIDDTHVNILSRYSDNNKRKEKYKQENPDEDSVSMTRFLEEKTKQKFLKIENLKLKNIVENLNKQIEALTEKRKQLKLLLRRVANIEKGKQNLPKLDPALPWVFAITPTFARYTQKADLVRLSQTLQHVANIHWILVEDSLNSTMLVRKVLIDSGLSFTHLNTRTPPVLQRKKGEKYNKHHRGVPQRNLGLKWIRRNINPEKTPGVVYFMDDDNTYHKSIFDEMRWTNKVSVWPVALTGGARWAGPIVSNGKVIGFHTNWAKDRKFPIDMAAFAVNLNVLLHEYPDAKIDDSAKRGYLEPTFLSSITTIGELEPLADNCTKILVWHTRTEVPKDSINGEKKLKAAGTPSNPAIEI